MFQSQAKLRVRYAETDQMGYVYYGNYPMYYEVARVEVFRDLGFPYKQLEEMGIGMPVLKMNIDYKLPAKYDEELTIKVTVPEMPTARMRFVFEIFNDSGALINVGETVLIFMNMDTYRPMRLPEVMEQLLKPYFE